MSEQGNLILKLQQLNEALIEAAKNKDFEKLKACVNFGAHVNFVICEGRSGYDNEKSALHYACENEDFESMLTLLNARASVNLPDKKKRRPIYYAADKGNVECVKELIKFNADVNQTFYDVKSKKLCNNSQREEIMKLLSDQSQLDTTLCEAAMEGNLSKLKEALSNGANKNCLVKLSSDRLKQWQAPLHYACKYGRVNCVMELIKQGANLNQRDEKLRTPMHSAAEKGSYDCVLALYFALAFVKPKDINSKRPIDYAKDKGHNEVVTLLGSEDGDNYDFTGLDCRDCLNNEVWIDAVDRNRRTLLHYACESGNVENVRALIDHGANVNLPCITKETPLHLACQYGSLDIVRDLIDAGAFINARDENGRRPKDLTSDVEIKSLLMSPSESYYEEQSEINTDEMDTTIDSNSSSLGETILPDCAICWTERRSVVLLPCGHVCVCDKCCDQLEMCPVCRTHIQEWKRIYIS